MKVVSGTFEKWVTKIRFAKFRRMTKNKNDSFVLGAVWICLPRRDEQMDFKYVIF